VDRTKIPDSRFIHVKRIAKLLKRWRRRWSSSSRTHNKT
jgi:hypothetical protein